MSNVILDRRRNNLNEEIKKQLIFKMSNMLETLRLSVIPSSFECVELQKLLREYLKYLSDKAIKEETLQKYEQIKTQIVFNDISTEKIKNNDILADLVSDPVIVSTLYTVGLRKLVLEEELTISAEQKLWIAEQGYIAQVSIVDNSNKHIYLALTSKGWLCFQRKTIIQQFRRSQGYTSLLLPKWLAVPQTKWFPETYKKALLLRRYYVDELKARDYVIFSFPENDQLLFGCRADKAKEIVYACAVTKDILMSEEDKKTLQRVIVADTVNQVCLVLINAMYSQQIIDELKLKPAVLEKIQTYVMEAAND